MVWPRRDLRLDDNPARAAATAAHDQVVALFALEPRQVNASEPLAHTRAGRPDHGDQRRDLPSRWADPLYTRRGRCVAAVTAWLEHVDDYPDTRDLPAIAGTSELSADLKFGTIAARTLVDVMGTETAGRAAFVRQLAWRDLRAHTLAERPDLPDVTLKERERCPALGEVSGDR